MSIFGHGSAHAQENGSLIGVWNGFLNQQSIVECHQVGGQETPYTLTLKNDSGAEIADRHFVLASNGTQHIVLDQLTTTSDRYGTYSVSSDENTTTPFFCHTTSYRLSGNQVDPVEYAYSLPMLSPRQGNTFGVFNSLHPDPSESLVYNWLSIINPESSTLSVVIERYDLSGTALPSIEVSSIPPGSRRDVALHDLGPSVGLYKIAATNNHSYVAFLTRFAPLGSRFAYAIPLLPNTGVRDPGPIAASTMGDALNWGEIANITDSPQTVLVEIRDRNGILLNADLPSVTLSPRSQHHILLNTYLGSANVGTFHVRSARPEGRILAQSLYYGRDANLRLDWAYASQGQNRTAYAWERVVSSLNTFLGAANWNKYQSASSSPLPLSGMTFLANGENISPLQLSAAPGGSLDVAFHERIGQDMVGFAAVESGSEDAEFSSELLRVFPSGNGRIGYIMNIPSAIIPSPETARTISQYGVTWEFDRPYRAGRFINGDWWVIPGSSGHVVVTSVTPQPAVQNGEHLNGSMVNPLSTLNQQAYDSRVFGWNPALGASFPLNLAANSSIVSTSSIESYPYLASNDSDPFPLAYGYSQVNRPVDSALRSGAILTVLPTPPRADDCFRPAYVGSTKRIFCSDDVRSDLLPSVPASTPPPNFQTLARAVLRPDLDLLLSNYYRTGISAFTHRPSYGREYALLMGDALLSLTMDYPLSMKQPVLNGIVQLGIDLYPALLANPLLFPSQGGYSIGREAVVRITGKLLDEPSMVNIQAEFAETQMAYFGDDKNPPQQLWNGWQNSGHPLAQNVLFKIDVGTDNFGRRFEHESYPLSDWGNIPYNPGSPATTNYPFTRPELYQRLLSYASIGPAMALRLMGLTQNTSAAYLAYVDRWMNSDGQQIRNALGAAAVQYGWNALTQAVDDDADYENPDTYAPFEGSCYSFLACDVYHTYRGTSLP